MITDEGRKDAIEKLREAAKLLKTGEDESAITSVKSALKNLDIELKEDAVEIEEKKEPEVVKEYLSF